MTKSLLKMGEAHIANVYKVTTTKVEDFDENHIGCSSLYREIRVRDVLLDGKSNVNIIYESLRKKLGLRKPKLALFIVRMVD
jgi:hypothetical protein